MGRIFIVWIGQTLWILEYTLRYWDPAIFFWFSGTVVISIIHGLSDLPLGKGWVQGDG